MIKNILLLKLLFGFFLIQAQSNTEFLNKYNKLNLEIGGAYFYGSEISALPSTLDYHYINYFAPRFGLHYDFLRTDKFNFKIGFSTFLLREIDEIRMDKIETPADFDWIDGLEVFSADWQFNIPITIEYITYLNKSKLTFNTSFMIGYQDFDYAETEYGLINHNTGEHSSFKGYYSRGDDVWHPNAQIGFGMYFPFEKWMLRTNLYYNIMLEKMYEGTFEFRGLRQSSDIDGTYSFSGNSFGIEFSIYLAKKKRKHKSKSNK